jgi:NTP pyrophosphatase (non-canonical NTP hydrolase)
MFNPFKKRIKTETLDSLINILLSEIDEIAELIEELRRDLEDLTDFVEERLD